MILNLGIWMKPALTAMNGSSTSLCPNILVLEWFDRCCSFVFSFPTYVSSACQISLFLFPFSFLVYFLPQIQSSFFSLVQQFNSFSFVWFDESNSVGHSSVSPPRKYLRTKLLSSSLAILWIGNYSLKLRLNATHRNTIQSKSSVFDF